VLLEIHTRDSPAAWAALGFAVTGDAIRVGPVVVRCDGGAGWTLRGDDRGDVDGIPTRWVAKGDGVVGARDLDHVVVITDSLDRTVDALVAVGGDERRRVAPMSFVRLGPVIVEVVERAEVESPFIWGLVAVVDDLASLPADLVAEPKDAVQPGRRIVTARAVEGLETALAFMTPRVRAH
jgi:hypothetical protein